MATEAVCVDAYYHRAPSLHYVTSADDVIHYYDRRPPAMTGRNKADHRVAWTTQRQQVPRPAPLSTGPVRKLSVDDGSSWPLSGAPGVSVAGGPSRRRAMPTSASDDAPPASSVNPEDCSFYSRRRLSAWSPLPASTLSRTLSEHTLDRSTRYRAGESRDDLLDEYSAAGDDTLESLFSPPRIAPISGQLSLVCMSLCVVIPILIRATSVPKSRHKTCP